MAERNPGLRLSRKWWEQPVLDILRIRTGHAEAEGGEDMGTEELEEEEEWGRVGCRKGNGMTRITRDDPTEV